MNIYLTWHLPTHGIHYTKNILGAFWRGDIDISKKMMFAEGLKQEELEHAFEKKSEGLRFDKVYYLHPSQEYQDKIHSRDKKRRRTSLNLDSVLSQEKTREFWEGLFSLEDEGLKGHLEYLEKTLLPGASEIYDQMLEDYWRIILDYSIEDQIWWMKEMSNAKVYYGHDVFQVVNVSKKYGLSDMRDYLAIGESLKRFLTEVSAKHKGAQYFVNISLGSYETQVVWFILVEAGVLPRNTRFISTYDRKDDPDNARYKNFSIKEVETNLLDNLRDKIQLFPDSNSKPRALANLKMQAYLKSGFAIMLLGPRGVGKSHMVRSAAAGSKSQFVHANCASFPDDTMAESQLFGYEKGAFTDAKERTEGLFHQAKDGILFLDEIHHLSKAVQAKLMTALQTDENNEFRFRRMKGKEEEKGTFKIVMATNRSIRQLRELLLPDFFDRIAQHVIEIPPLAETPEDREADWKGIWTQLRFPGGAPSDFEFLKWLKLQKLPGNFRDLQKIAIYYKIFHDFDNATRKLIPQKTAFEFAKSEYEKYHLEVKSDFSQQFDSSKTTKAMIQEFKHELANWAVDQFEGHAAAEAHFKKLGDPTTRKTLYEWQKYKS